MNRTTRDRDEEGRARSARPRDGLGRPLPYGAEGVLRQPEGVVRTPGETVREAQRLLDAGMPFHAHEVFEDAWKSGPAAERDLWQGLAQLAVGLTHAARGNREGGARLLRRGADRLTSRSWERTSGPDETPDETPSQTPDEGANESPAEGAEEGAKKGVQGTRYAAAHESAYGIELVGLVSWARELADRAEASPAPVDATAEAPRLRGADS
ncbi:DUF309 domain-containing protein [Streptomyces narbonensis]|uniref:DUF309 domain-containing protein n=1 Tax=Streptomyces narbonensis TaxID=67333 RepID=UPI001987F745|nr:DUF309 domain-containing protein [Streptomyces narbonensis]GGW05835.1 hypothetical protein GCM10010230_46600 [Streptomyces narbonensis]